MSKGYTDGYQYSTYGADASAAGGGQNEFTRLSQVIGTNIQKISQNVGSMQKMVQQLGTQQDTESLRSQLLQVQHYTNQLAKDTNQHLKELSQHSHVGIPSQQRQRKILKERLMDDFSEALKNFQAVQRMATQKEKESVQRVRAQSGLKGSFYGDEEQTKSSNLIDLQSPTQAPIQAQMQMDEEINLQLLQEREQGIRKLESDILDVNQIFKDLATMVHDQGEVIDSIEANVESAVIHVADGAQQLSRAREHQTKARKKKCVLLIIAVVVITVVIVVIVVTTKK